MGIQKIVSVDNRIGTEMMDNPIISLIQVLRGENGCPWDKKQTPRSIARYLIEEVYELVDAIVSEAPEKICEEAGDVLFQLLFVIQMFKEKDEFGLEDVITKNIQKMIRRHPHVFGDEVVESEEQVKENWLKIKKEEKKQTDHQSAIEDIPKSLPALMRAYRISDRAANEGFDWNDISGVMEKTREELDEFEAEVASGSTENTDNYNIEVEFGDILFTLVNVARFAKINPETALMSSIAKFEKRFKYMESEIVKEGLSLSSMGIKEMQKRWDASKKHIDGKR